MVNESRIDIYNYLYNLLYGSEKYKAFEDGINNVIQEATEDASGTYHIQEGSLLSADADETSNANNAYFTFVKSFIVNIDVPSETPLHYGDLYIGLGNDIISTEQDIEELVNVQYYDKDNPQGDYQISFEETSYLWLCTTGEITSVTSNGFTVPMEDAIVINDKNCYRSANSITSGTMYFSINK